MKPSQELLAQYGAASIQLEIAQNNFNEVKRQVADCLNSPEPKTVEAEEAAKRG